MENRTASFKVVRDAPRSPISEIPDDASQPEVFESDKALKVIGDQFVPQEGIYSIWLQPWLSQGVKSC